MSTNSDDGESRSGDNYEVEDSRPAKIQKSDDG
jgi:hypothetical protein